MNRTFSFLVCAGALIFAGCTSDSKLPNPSGKGTVRAIHAMHGATDVSFKIEERTLGSLIYKQCPGGGGRHTHRRSQPFGQCF